MDATRKKNIAQEVARALFDIGAIHFNAKDPFIFTSGLKSPVYVDCRKVISFPEARNMIIAFALEVIEGACGKDAFDYIAGGETAGIPYAAWLSDRLDLPMLYVRKKPKGFGRLAQIEGDMEPEKRVLLAEDLMSEGTSKMNFCEALRNAGADLRDIFVVFYYNIFDGAEEFLKKENLTLHYLTTWQDALDVAREDARFDEETLDAVASFLKSPKDWSEAA